MLSKKAIIGVLAVLIVKVRPSLSVYTSAPYLLDEVPHDVNENIHSDALAMRVVDIDVVVSTHTDYHGISDCLTWAKVDV